MSPLATAFLAFCAVVMFVIATWGLASLFDELRDVRDADEQRPYDWADDDEHEDWAA